MNYSPEQVAQFGTLIALHIEEPMTRFEYTSPNMGSWHSVVGMPLWDLDLEYRVRRSPDRAAWEALKPAFKYIARDRNGFVQAYRQKPNAHRSAGIWQVFDPKQNAVSLMSFTFFKQGDVDWHESLIIRPGAEHPVDAIVNDMR